MISVKKLTRFCIFLFALPVPVKKVSGQMATDNLSLKTYNHQAGLLVGKAIRTGYDDSMPYTYRPVLFQAEYQKRLTKKDRKVLFDYVLQPQVNFVRYKDSLLNGGQKTYTKSWEAGVNINLLLHAVLFYNVQKKTGAEIYLQGGSGPHYISSSPARQTKGFIFSDNIFLGLRATVTQRILFDVRGGIRHLSNAGLKNPNKGLDNVLIGAGIRFLK